jgi:hypothetical protein
MFDYKIRHSYYYSMITPIYDAVILDNFTIFWLLATDSFTPSFYIKA